jgi:hypothetical protein
MCLRGVPSRFQSDRGEELVVASKQIAMWNFNDVMQWAGRKGVEWVLVPTGGQHFNGQAEKMIGLIKKQIWRSFEGKKHSHEETVTILQEAAQVVNSRPLACNPWAEGRPLCPEDLMPGRARSGQPVVPLETGQQLTRRFRIVQQAKEEFWDRWVKEVFPSLLKQQKWFKYKRDAKIGDIVLRKDETAAGQTYKYARVTKVHVGTDGKVRAADIEYKVPGKARFRSTTRPIHKLVLIITVEEQVIEEDEGGGEALEPEPRDQGKRGDSGAQEREENGIAEMEGAENEEQPQLGEFTGESEEGIQREEPDPPTIAKRCSAPTGIRFSEGEEEMVDIGTALKRGRGRPRKLKEMDLLDPHKGSVTDSGEGVCVDPGEKGTILEAGGPGPPRGGKGWQLASDSGGEET